MEKETKFVSLFDYLGHAAGGDLGKAVAAKAKETRQPIQLKDVKNSKYTGKVMMYTESFLDSYFKPDFIVDYNITSQDDELPF